MRIDRVRASLSFLGLLALGLGCKPAAAPAAECVDPDSAAAEQAAEAEKEAAAVAANTPIAPTESHAFSILDMLAMRRVGDLQVSPDGSRALVNVRITDMGANKGRTDIWSVDLKTGEATQLTTDPASDFNARWAPDGKTVYFVSTRSGLPQIYKKDHKLDEPGKATQVTDVPTGAANLVVSPDGKSLAFTADVYLDCPDLKCTADRSQAHREKTTTGVVYDSLFIRHWDTWKDGKRSQLFVVPAEGGTPVQVSKGLAADVPSKPFGGPEEVAFTPDSKQLVFAARDVGKEEPWSTNFDLFTAPADGSAAPKKLTQNPAWDTHPVFSPDGKTLAYTAMKRPGFEADRFRIMLASWPAGDASKSERVLADDWDRSVRGMSFSADGKSLIVTAQDLGQVSIFSIDVASGEVEKLVGEGTNSAPAIAGDKLVFMHNDLKHPDEVHTAKLDGSEIAPLTHFNDELVSAAKMGDYEQFSFKGAKGDTVYAYVVKPVDFDESKKYPVAFLIHGGPQGSFGNKFHYRWNPQAYAGAGYVAVMVDFHGSTGYGQAFTDAISKDWGGKPLQDLKKGLKAATDKYSFMDADKVCALGASYGGFMINWIAGNWPDRFSCLVNHDGVFDQRSMYYSTEELWFPEWEFGGPYHQNSKLFEKFNPARFVSKWKTPMLVVHGALDYRVPLEQGLAAYTALQRQGIESRFLYFPDENHWVLKPHNSKQWHDEVLRWLDDHLK